MFIISSMLFVSACSEETTASESKDIKNTAAVANAETAEFQVSGMYCASCPFTVKSAVERVKGVQGVNVNSKGNTGTVKVQFDQSKTDLNKIKQSVLDLGYGVDK